MTELELLTAIRDNTKWIGIFAVIMAGMMGGCFVVLITFGQLLAAILSTIQQ